MSDTNLQNDGGTDSELRLPPHRWILAEVVPELPQAAPPPPRRVSQRRLLPLLLFIATCLSTVLVQDWVYGLSVMTILICHEAGHWLQARRYGVRASLPFFIPMPLSPIGTLGAVIGMDARIANRKALFDIGITGPLAGLVPTIIFCVLGLQRSETVFAPSDPANLSLGSPYLFSILAKVFVDPVPEADFIDLHQMAFAGWVGMLITALNLLPIGQLDGGHILYGLLRKNAHRVASFLLMTAAVAIVYYGLWWWWLMLVLLILMGAKHPPTADDTVPLGAGRIIVGWLTLAFVPLGFTPIPFLR